MTIRTKIIAGMLPALLFACGGGTGPEPDSSALDTCSGGKCDSTGFDVIPAGIWAACELTEGQVEDELGCSMFGADEVLGPISVVVSGTTAQGGAIRGGAFNQSGAHFPAILPHDAYPIDLDVLLMFESDHAVEGFTALQLHMPVRLEAPPTEPVVLEQPFDLWRIQFATRERLALFDGEWTVGAGGAFTDADGNPREITLRPTVIAQPDVVQEVYLPVPPNAQHVDGRLRVGDNLTELGVSFEGPGRWVGTLDGLRRAGDRDVDMFTDTPEPTEPIVEPPVPVETCSFDYLGWLTDFKPLIGSPEGQLKVEEIECKPVSAEAFAAWHELLVLEIEAGAPASTSVLDGDEMIGVSQILEARPDSDADGSYSLALSAYEARLTMYAPASTSVIDDNEATILDAVVDGRPRAIVSDEAWKSWFTLFMARMTMYSPASTSIVDNDERAVLANVEAMSPTALGETAYETWFTEYMRYLQMYAPASTSVVDSAEAGVLAVLHQVRPMSVSTEAYDMWLRATVDRLRDAGSTVDAGERSVLIDMSIAKPCVADVAAAQVQLDTMLQTVTANADLLTEMAGVTGCGQ